ncbi:PH domain-containing protein [Streptomyces sp. NPDC088812]|uniref:PH domain-containing protein n=1 Tax=Streptomyces sp. NPDC088812 TaxID=3365905 RepID=UPI0037FC1A7D
MDDGIEREYRRRRGVPAAQLALAAVAALVAVHALNWMTLSGPTFGDVLALVAWLCLGGGVALEQWRARTSVSADGITVRGPLRTRTAAWSDVYGIRVEDSRQGSPRWQAYLYRTDGRRVRLPHLDEVQVTDPIAEVADLCATAVRLGLTSFEARPEPEERIRRGTRRRTAWRRAGIGGLVVAAVLFAVDVWAILTDRPTHSTLLLVGVPLLCVPLFFLLLDRLGEALAARRPTGPA